MVIAVVVTSFVMVPVAIVLGVLVKCSLFCEGGKEGSGGGDASGSGGDDGAGFFSDGGGGQEKN